MTSDTDFDVDAYFKTMTSTMDLSVKKEWEDTIKHHLKTAHAMAKICDAAPVPPNTLELANTFQQKELR